MPFLTQGKTNWKYILIVVILAIIVGGGIFGWIKRTEVPVAEFPEIKKPIRAPEIGVEISPDLKSLQVKKEGKPIQIYTIKQWQEWAEKNWSSLRLEPIIMDELGVIGDEPEDFIQFISVSLSPNEKKLAFSVNSKEIALATFSMKGILNLETSEVSMIPIIIGGDVEKFIWAPTGKHFAYTIGTARAEWDALGVDDILNKKNSFMLDGKEIGLILEEPSPVHFIPQFRNLKWSYDGNKLYFKTNDKGNKGEIEWVINVDGTGLKRIIEDETANWKTYRNEKYGFEFKYPKEFAEDERCRAIEMENVIGIGMRIFITIKDSGGLSLSEYVDKEITFDIESRKNITVGSREAISIEYRFGGLGRYGKVVYLLKDDKIFNFSFTAGGECPSTDISELVVFDGILSTFRFLE